MAERMGAEYVELANTQYYGWAWRNREQLLPSREQLRARRGGHARASASASATRMQIFFVVPDYFETPAEALHERARARCSSRIAPDGTALPCHAARMLPGLELPERARARACARSGTTRRPSTASAARTG